MSRFFSEKFAALDPYTPGEQPRDMQYVKLNTNESPFPPSAEVLSVVTAEVERLNLYCDPECTALRKAIADLYGLAPENILPVNGSDEALYFAFMAFCDSTHPIAFADITYGFYPVYAAINRVPAHIIPLADDFSVRVEDYYGLGENIVIANPNAPTGMALNRDDIESIIRSNPDNVVIIDEAYVDFGGESVVPLIEKYDNLLVVQTFSKSRSLAGARLGFAMGSAALIGDLNTIKFSTNPYNVNRMTQAAGVAAVMSNDYYMENCRVIQANRDYTAKTLEALGFQVLPSKANFLFARSPDMGGKDLYLALKRRGVLVRHFDKDRIRDFLRITVGSREQMETLIAATKAILQERGA